MFLWSPYVSLFSFTLFAMWVFECFVDLLCWGALSLASWSSALRHYLFLMHIISHGFSFFRFYFFSFATFFPFYYFLMIVLLKFKSLVEKWKLWFCCILFFESWRLFKVMILFFCFVFSCWLKWKIFVILCI